MSNKAIDEPSEDIVAKAKQAHAESHNPFSRFVLFMRQVFAELKKVVTPTRRELLSYTGVVLVFVIIMMTIVWVLDKGFAAAVLFVFGPSSPG